MLLSWQRWVPVVQSFSGGGRMVEERASGRVVARSERSLRKCILGDVLVESEWCDVGEFDCGCGREGWSE
jgi:hypothetical protein